MECIETKKHGKLKKSRINGLVESLQHKKELEQKKIKDSEEYYK